MYVYFQIIVLINCHLIIYKIDLDVYFISFLFFHFRQLLFEFDEVSGKLISYDEMYSFLCTTVNLNEILKFNKEWICGNNKNCLELVKKRARYIMKLYTKYNIKIFQRDADGNVIIDV